MPPEQQAGATSGHLLRRWVVAFGEFWWDFLVGDTPELVPGVALVLGGGALAVHEGLPRAIVIGAMPVLAILVLCASVLRRGNAKSS